MNKQIILDQCDKIENVVNEATASEEEARNNAEKFKNIKEDNTKLLGILNDAKNIYWELERTLRIIEIDKEYDNTGDELENLKIRVKDLLADLDTNVKELINYDSVKETVHFYEESIKDANDFISGNTSARLDENEFHFDTDEDAHFNSEFFDSTEVSVTDQNVDVVDASSLEEADNVSDLESSNDTFDFSSDFTVDTASSDTEEKHDDLQKVVDVTDFNSNVSEINAENSSADDDFNVNDNDSSLSELNDLFNYLNEDSSFNA